MPSQSQLQNLIKMPLTSQPKGSTLTLPDHPERCGFSTPVATPPAASTPVADGPSSQNNNGTSSTANSSANVSSQQNLRNGSTISPSPKPTHPAKISTTLPNMGKISGSSLITPTQYNFTPRVGEENMSSGAQNNASTGSPAGGPPTTGLSTQPTTQYSQGQAALSSEAGPPQQHIASAEQAFPSDSQRSTLIESQTEIRAATKLNASELNLYEALNAAVESDTLLAAAGVGCPLELSKPFTNSLQPLSNGLVNKNNVNQGGAMQQDPQFSRLQRSYYGPLGALVEARRNVPRGLMDIIAFVRNLPAGSPNAFVGARLFDEGTEKRRMYRPHTVLVRGDWSVKTRKYPRDGDIDFTGPLRVPTKDGDWLYSARVVVQREDKFEMPDFACIVQSESGRGEPTWDDITRALEIFAWHKRESFNPPRPQQPLHAPARSPMIHGPRRYGSQPQIQRPANSTMPLTPNGGARPGKYPVSQQAARTPVTPISHNDNRSGQQQPAQQSCNGHAHSPRNSGAGGSAPRGVQQSVQRPGLHAGSPGAGVGGTTPAIQQYANGAGSPSNPRAGAVPPDGGQQAVARPAYHPVRPGVGADVPNPRMQRAANGNVHPVNGMPIPAGQQQQAQKSVNAHAQPAAHTMYSSPMRQNHTHGQKIESHRQGPRPGFQQAMFPAGNQMYPQGNPGEARACSTSNVSAPPAANYIFTPGTQVFMGHDQAQQRKRSFQDMNGSQVQYSPPAKRQEQKFPDSQAKTSPGSRADLLPNYMPPCPQVTAGIRTGFHRQGAAPLPETVLPGYTTPVWSYGGQQAQSGPMTPPSAQSSRSSMFSTPEMTKAPAMIRQSPSPYGLTPMMAFPPSNPNMAGQYIRAPRGQSSNGHSASKFVNGGYGQLTPANYGPQYMPGPYESPQAACSAPQSQSGSYGQMPLSQYSQAVQGPPSHSHPYQQYTHTSVPTSQVQSNAYGQPAPSQYISNPQAPLSNLYSKSQFTPGPSSSPFLSFDQAGFDWSNYVFPG